MGYSSFGHKFVGGDVEEFFNGECFIEEERVVCLTCGAQYDLVRINYEGEWTLMGTTLDLISECSRDTSAHGVEGVVVDGCNCLVCKG